MKIRQADKILLVEDDLEIRDCVSEFLREEGYAVESSANGALALAHLKEASTLPSLILLDLMMPVMDGFEFRTQQTKDEELAQIPTVLLSAHGQIEQRAKAAGMEYVLRKPIELDDLLRLTREHCK